MHRSSSTKQLMHKLTEPFAAKDLQATMEDRMKNDTNQLASLTNVRVQIQIYERQLLTFAAD